MAKLGSDRKPAVARVKTPKRAHEVTKLCNERGWKVIVGIEPDQPEDISDIEKLMNPQTVVREIPEVGRNAPCPCGSGLKYKKCCLGK